MSLAGTCDLRVNFVRTHAAEGRAEQAAGGRLPECVAAVERASTASGEPDLNAALRIPGIVDPAERRGRRRVGSGAAAAGALEQALGSLNQFREREGAETGASDAGAQRGHSADAEGIEEISAEALAGIQARLKERLAELLERSAVDPQRLAQEAAMLADRSDIGEEIARLKIHARQLD